MTLLRETVAGTALLRRPSVDRSSVLVLLHGIGSNAASWEKVLAALDPSIEAIAWDAPGYGASAPLAHASPASSDYAARLRDLLDAMGVSRITLAGHSLGALFAASFAAASSERVSALALLSPALGYRVPAGQRLPEPVQARIDELDRLGAVEFAARRSARLVYRPEDKPDVLASVQRAMAAVHSSGYAQAVRALGAGDLLADTARISAPAIIAVGTQDVVTPPGNAKAAFTALPCAERLVEVPGVGHALPQEAPDTVAELLAHLVALAERSA